MKHLLIFLIACLAAPLVRAQELPFLQWSTADGLAQSQVRCIYEDHLGYLWIGTLGGVSRFDGNDFINYSRQDGLLGNQVNAIAEWGDSLVVFGSVGGLTFFDGQHFSNVRFPDDYSSAQVNDIQSVRGALLIATEKGTLRFNDGEFVFGSDDGEHVKRWINGFADGSLPGFYTITKSAIIREAKGGMIDTVLTDKNLGATIMDALPDGEGGLLIATIGRGLVHYSNGNLEFLLPQEGMVSENLTGITTGRNGDFWVKSRDGFARVSLGASAEVDAFTTTEGLPNSDVRALLCDSRGNLWLGTNGSGLLKFMGRKVQHFNSAHGLSGDIVMVIEPDGEGGHWIGTYDNGITHSNADTILHYGVADGLLNTRVWCADTDTSGKVWFGTSGGLSVFENGAFKTYTQEEGLPHKQVLSLLAEPNGQLWVGTARGLVHYLPHSDRFVQIEPIPQTKVRAIVRHSDGDLWIASNSGVYSIKPEGTLLVNESMGLPDNSVYCLATSPDGALWAGTESGLCAISSDGKVKPIVLQGGFGANHINFIAFGGSEDVWLGTNDGVFHGRRSEGQWSFVRKGEHDGVSFLETNQNAVLVEEDRIWFGTSEAMTVMVRDDEADDASGNIPAVHIAALRINLEDPNWSRYGDSLQVYGSWPQPLTVPHTDNHFTFYFDALGASDPERVRYQYILEGIEDEWEPVTETDFATYSQLPYNDYVFKVRAVAADGSVGQEEEFAFTIMPPFWLSWWFIALEILAVGSIVYLIYRSRRRAFLEKVEKERLEYKTRMLALEQQTLNSSMNRHFIFNALNSIQYYINRKDRLAANKYLSSFAKLIRKNLDSSQVNFTSLREEIERLELYLELEHMRFKDKFDYEIRIDEDVDQEAVKVPAMLLQPFLENSIWHGILPREELGHIDVEVRMQGSEQLAFIITDNGIGIETSRNNKVDRGDHISQGMNITSGRIELLRKMTRKHVELIGPYELKNGDNSVKGTRVELLLPADFQGIYTN